MAKSGVRDKQRPRDNMRRPKPSAPKAGFRIDGNRYGCGGKVSKTKKS